MIRIFLYTSNLKKKLFSCFLPIKLIYYTFSNHFLIAFNYLCTASDIKPCAAGDGKCIIENINKVFAEKNQGDESFGLTKLEPFKMDDIIIKQDPTNPVAIYLGLLRPVVYGVKNVRALKVK